MADREIACTQCSTNLGLIRDARLRTDIQHFCKKCVNAAFDRINELESRVNTLERENRAMRSADALSRAHGATHNNPFGDVFGDIFGGKR